MTHSSMESISQLRIGTILIYSLSVSPVVPVLVVEGSDGGLCTRESVCVCLYSKKRKRW